MSNLEQRARKFAKSRLLSFDALLLLFHAVHCLFLIDTSSSHKCRAHDEALFSSVEHCLSTHADGFDPEVGGGWLLNYSVRMIHVCVSNGQTAASANLTGNRVIMSFEGVSEGGRGKGGVLQYARGSKGGAEIQVGALSCVHSYHPCMCGREGGGIITGL